jgi:hypothetical protein
MNERIQELARQSGATDENGSRATTIFCFTDQELKGFAELIVKECAATMREIAYDDPSDDWEFAYNSGVYSSVDAIQEKFGVE